MGCDFCCNIKLIALIKFQSTHPSWGATLNITSVERKCQISIHAPIVGCDLFFLKIRIKTVKFQSTHPSWGATSLKSLIFSAYRYFNPRTHRGVRLWARTCYIPTIPYFNPRTHRGVRLSLQNVLFVKGNFNPRTHRGVRRRQDERLDSHSKISIHAPIVGCDLKPTEL